MKEVIDIYKATDRHKELLHKVKDKDDIGLTVWERQLKANKFIIELGVK
jgi:hypothetical protein